MSPKSIKFGKWHILLFPIKDFMKSGKKETHLGVSKLFFGHEILVIVKFISISSNRFLKE